MPVMLQFVNLDYKISCFSWLVLVRTGHSSFLLADWSPSCSSGCGCWGFHTLDVQPPGACRPAARPYCRLPSASTSLTTAAHTILQLRNQMYWLKEEQGRKVYIESIKSLQPQTFRPQHKNCLVQAEVQGCPVENLMHSHPGLSLTDLWKSPIAALPVVPRSVFNYIFTIC